MNHIYTTTFRKIKKTFGFLGKIRNGEFLELFWMLSYQFSFYGSIFENRWNFFVSFFSI